MIGFTSFRAGVLAAAFAICLSASPTAIAQDAGGNTVRPEVGKPLQAAQDAIKAGNHKDALARLQAQIPKKNPMRTRVRVSALATRSA